MISRRLFAAGTAAALLPAVRATALAQATSAPLEVPTISPRPTLDPVNVAYAASLVGLMEHEVSPAVAHVGLRFLGEGKGSVALAKEIETGALPIDVFISADTKLLDDLGAGSGVQKKFVSWYVTFAATRLVLGYSRQSPFAAHFADVARGKAPLESAFAGSNLRIGRTDPALDPKGYRSYLAMMLLELAGDVPKGFTRRVLGEPANPSQILPEETLLTRLETGDVDIAFLYRTEAIERGVPVIELPKEANLGDPALADTYRAAVIEAGGVERRGAPITYAIAIVNGAPDSAPAERFVAWMLSSTGRAVLERAGVDVLRPVVRGDASAVPAAIRAEVAPA